MTPQQSVVLRRGDSGPGRGRRVRAARPLRRPAWRIRPTATASATADLRRAASSRPSSPSSSGAASSSTASSAGPRMPSSTAPAGRSATACCATCPSTSSRATTSWPCRPASPSSVSRPARSTVIHGRAPTRPLRAFQAAVGLDADGTVGPETMRAFAGLRRSVSGGSANALREREQIRRSGYSLSGRTIVLDPGHGGGDAGRPRAPRPRRGPPRPRPRAPHRGAPVRPRRRASSSPAPRRTDGGTDEERAAFANSCDADLVLSLHTDHSGHGLGPRRPRRTSTVTPTTPRHARLVGHRRELRRPAPARGRGPHGPDRLPHPRPHVAAAAPHPHAGGAARLRLPQPRGRRGGAGQRARPSTTSPRPSSSRSSASTSARPTPPAPACCGSTTCAATSRPCARSR